MTKVKAQISNECQMLKKYAHPLIQTQPTLVKMHNGKKSNFSKNPGIPTSSPFCKGGLRGIFLIQPGFIENLLKLTV